MSTEHQQYSTENQVDALRRYAEVRNTQIVRTYSDEARSGLNIEGRNGLRELLSDVESGRADYTDILVYDVSRWGRFQDVDESAYYEYICKRANVRVHYCAEQFENDGSLSSSLLKTIKRTMAGEYSRGPTSTLWQYQSDVFRNPADPASRLHLARVLRQRGDADGAAAQEWAAAQLTPPDGGPLYAALRQRINNDWAADVYETNPVSNVKSRKRVALRRLDSCVLSWNELSETLNTASRTVKSSTYTVSLGRLNPQDIKLTGGNNIDFPNSPDKSAVTSSLVVQVDFAYIGRWQPFKPLFALLPAPTFTEANGLLVPIRDIVNSCRSQQ